MVLQAAHSIMISYSSSDANSLNMIYCTVRIKGAVEATCMMEQGANEGLNVSVKPLVLTPEGPLLRLLTHMFCCLRVINGDPTTAILQCECLKKAWFAKKLFILMYLFSSQLPFLLTMQHSVNLCRYVIVSQAK